MAETARARSWNGNQCFDYRLIAPLFDHEDLVTSAAEEGDALTTAVRDIHGRQTATGTLRRAENDP